MYRYSRLSPILDNSNDRLPLLVKYMYTIIIIQTLFPPGGDNYNHQITNMKVHALSESMREKEKKYAHTKKTPQTKTEHRYIRT